MECREIFLASYGRISPDLSKWMALTKKRIFNPVKFFRWLVSHRFWAASMVISWYYCWRQILFGRRYMLFGHPIRPLPTTWARRLGIARELIGRKNFKSNWPACLPKRQ
jgi:hypothetical protein